MTFSMTFSRKSNSFLSAAALPICVVIGFRTIARVALYCSGERRVRASTTAALLAGAGSVGAARQMATATARVIGILPGSGEHLYHPDDYAFSATGGSEMGCFWRRATSRIWSNTRLGGV